MRHLFRPPGSVQLLTHLVVQPAGFLLLILLARHALLLGPRQRSTRRAVPVATVAPPADHHLPMTTLAAEDPAILWDHL